MKLNYLFGLLTATLGITHAQAKAVFAHFMVGNVPSFSVADWESDIVLAQAASIDAFVLNIAATDSNNAASVDKAFQAAANKNFKLLFSFDYAAQGPWDQQAVINMINGYASKAAYWKEGGKPFVSTFEGGSQSGQWSAIKAATNCFLVPEWSNLGAQGAVNTGLVDGLFSWDAWPVGATDMGTSGDQTFRNALGTKPYMMPVAPWFFTNLPTWTKNWLWRGDDLWYDRWQQVLTLQPEYVEIISWNDYGESHYIGPLHDSEYGLFSYGGAPYNYVQDMPHDGWRQFLPYIISQYKTGSASITTEGLTAWYRRNPATACSTGGTTGNSGPNGQSTTTPYSIVQDKVFFSALLSSSATVTVSIGGNSQAASWENTPSGGSGIYHGSAAFNGRTGDVVVTVTRGTTQVAKLTGASITTACTNNIENWNAWVGSTGGSSSGGGSGSGGSGSGSYCVAGKELSDPNMSGLCSYTCSYNYCPSDVCTCTQYSTTPNTEPAITGQAGYPLVGEGCGYVGLCSYVCNHGYCPSTACSSDPAGAAGC